MDPTLACNHDGANACFLQLANDLRAIRPERIGHDGQADQPQRHGTLHIGHAPLGQLLGMHLVKGRGVGMHLVKSWGGGMEREGVEMDRC